MLAALTTLAVLITAVIVGARVVTGSQQMQVSKVISLGGCVFNETATYFGNEVIDKQYTLPLQQAPGTPLPQPGVISLYTSTTAGSILMTNPAHGITTGVRVDLYWQDGNGITYVQYGCTVGTVSGQTVPISGGTITGVGAALPVAGTQVTVSVSTSFPIAFNGDPLKLLVNCTPTTQNPSDAASCTVSFQTAAPVDELTTLVGPGNIYEWNQGDLPSLWAAGSGPAITQVFVSHNSQTVPQTIQIGVLAE